MPTSPEWSFLASRLVKEVATLGGDVSGLVPEFVREQLVRRLAEREGAPGLSREPARPVRFAPSVPRRLRFRGSVCVQTPEVTS